MRDIIRRMERGKRSWPAEIVLRSFGLAMLGMCAASALWVFRLVHQPPPHEARPIECLAALLAVIGWSLGWAFFAVGPGLFKLVPVPQRYWRYSSKGPPR
ncbi:MAG: hypothetical protein J7485_09390 [Sphingobium sp.]|nr:hypothetical protein [Sphingobium sp.]